jgi:hypothetical protein
VVLYKAAGEEQPSGSAFAFSLQSITKLESFRMDLAINDVLHNLVIRKLELIRGTTHPREGPKKKTSYTCRC